MERVRRSGIVAALRTVRVDVREFADVVVPIFIACFPLAWLALLDKGFYTDWNNHLWIIGYTGEYFHQHFAFPMTLNTDQRIGITFPLFYGTLFYPIAGIISSFTSATVALRVLLVGVFWLQSSQVTKLLRTIFPDRYTAWSIAAVISFGVYPLTNLYNRAAITEFVAASLLISAVSLWLRAIYVGLRRAWPLASLAWLLLVLVAGTHPITGLLGGGLWAALIIGSFFVYSGRAFLTKMTLGHLIMSLLALSPWLYATFKFHKHLLISSISSRVEVFARTIDLPWSRLLPIPFDIRTVTESPDPSISTPFLDAQINVGLLIVACFLGLHAFHKFRKGGISSTREIGAAALCLGLFTLALYCSLSQSIWHAAPSLLRMIQFSYRLVTYCDLLLFLAIIFLLSSLSKFQPLLQSKLRICLAVAVVLMTQSVLVKFTHAAAIRNRSLPPGTRLFEDRASLKELPSLFYGLDGYVSRDGFAPPLHGIPTVKLRPAANVDFGIPEGIRLVSPGWFSTNIQAFPWNRLVLNGKEVPKAATHISSDNTMSLANFPAMAFVGFVDDTLAAHADLSHMLLEYRFAPHRSYLAMRYVSVATLIIWSGVLLIAGCYSSWRNPNHITATAATTIQTRPLTIVAPLIYWVFAFVVVGTTALIFQTIARDFPLVPPSSRVFKGAAEPHALILTTRIRFNSNFFSTPGKSNPLVITGRTGATDTTSVDAIAPNLICVHINHGKTAAAQSNVIPINLRDTYIIEVIEGQDRIAVNLNHHPILTLEVTPYPTANEEVSFGSNRSDHEISGHDVSVQILSSTVKRVLDYPPKMLTTMEIQLPLNRPINTPGDPLIATGVPGAGDIVSIRYEPGDQIRFQIDHWGTPPVLSEALTIRPEKIYVVQVRFDDDDIVVSLNDREVDRCGIKAFNTTREQITLGENRIGGGTTTSKFSGAILTRSVYLR